MSNLQARRVNVRGIIIKDSAILAQKFIKSDGSATDYWGTPGGGLDIGESLYAGLKREMIEETGITPRIGKLLFIQQFVRERRDGTCDEGMELFFHIENSDDYTAINLEETTHGTLEVAEIAFIDPKSENIKPDFLKTIDIAQYIAADYPVYISDDL